MSKEQKRQAFYTQSPEEIFKTLDASEQGLSSQEAAKRLADYGRNELDEGEKKSLLMKFLAVSYTHLTLPTIYSV